MKTFRFGFGDKHIELALPEERVIQVINGQSVEAITDVPGAVKAALRNPKGTPPLKQVVRYGDKVAIVVSDISRSWIKAHQFLPVILDELNEAGVPDADIFIMIALGYHRRHTEEENVTVCGKEVCGRVPIYQHDSKDKDGLVYVGTTSRGSVSYLNKRVVDADKVILTGGVAYHLMAGFSGGRKSVVPGICDYEAILSSHHFCLSEEVGKGLNPRCAGGKLKGNDMNEDMIEIAAFLNPAFLFNAVYTPEGKFAGFFAGHWLHAWEDACKTAQDIYGTPIAEKADLTIASAGGYPRDISLYQGTKTIQNAAAATRPGGVIICLMECRYNQDPPDYIDFFNYTAYDLEMLLRDHYDQTGFVCLKAQLVAKTVSIIVVTLPENLEFVRRAGMIAVASVEEAMAIAREKLGRDDYTITVMTHGGSTVPFMKN